MRTHYKAFEEIAKKFFDSFEYVQQTVQKLFEKTPNLEYR